MSKGEVLSVRAATPGRVLMFRFKRYVGTPLTLTEFDRPAIVSTVTQSGNGERQYEAVVQAGGMCGNGGTFVASNVFITAEPEVGALYWPERV